MAARIFVSILKISPKFKKAVWKRVYQFLAAKYKTEDWTFMNYGFQSLNESKKIELKKEDEINRFFIQLYHFVAYKVELKNKMVLEVGSGRGGGADYVERYFQPSKMFGVDYSRNAIEFCNRVFKDSRVDYKLGDAENLPFENDSLDIVINVESSHCYADVSAFFAEVYRVLKSGGYFSFADFRDKEPFEDLKKDLSNSGLEIVKSTNISKEVLRALDDFNEEKMKRFGKMFGSWLKKPLSEFAGMKGSSIYEDLSNGNTVYYHYLLRKN